MAKSEHGDLSVTALYTSAAWTWGRLPGAELLATPEARWVFRLTNLVLWIARLFRRDLPSLRCSLLQRHLAIDHLLSAAQPAQVLELASGLSRRGASDHSSRQYTEMDLPAVMARKRELLARTLGGRAVLAHHNLKLLSGDVRREPLEPLVRPGDPLFVIAEGLFMYLDATEQRDLWARIRRLFDTAPGAFVFDLVPASEQPRPGRIGRALEAAMKAFTGGRSFERDARTRQDIAAELGLAGFSRVELIEPRAVASAWSLPFPDARTQQLLFLCRP